MEQGKILSESLEKYGHRSATSNFEEDSASGELPSASSLLLDPPLTDEEISANLEELDMMIQSAGPFQHPRAVGQNYAHGANSYHRQPAYHPQVNSLPYLCVLIDLTPANVASGIQCTCRWNAFIDGFQDIVYQGHESQCKVDSPENVLDALELSHLSNQLFALWSTRCSPNIFSIAILWCPLHLKIHIFLVKRPLENGNYVQY